MALTVTTVKPIQVPGKLYFTVNSILLDNSYEAEGEPLSLQALGFGKEAVFSHADVQVINKSEQAVFVPNTASYDGTKLHVWDAATGKEIAGTKDLSKVTVVVECYCTSN